MPQYYKMDVNDLHELQELSINVNGIAQNQKTLELSTHSKCLVIGLGGMGVKTVNRLKMTLFKRCKQLCANDIQFLCIDTDEQELRNLAGSGVIVPSETLDLYCSSIRSDIQMPPEFRRDSINSIMPPESANFGFGYNRLSGRLALMNVDIFSIIEQKIAASLIKLSVGVFGLCDYRIYVISGVGGYTGSTLCIDIPYIVRKVAAGYNIPDSNVKILGQIYMPDVYECGGTHNILRCYRNAYAALKEIDYYMNIEKIDEVFEAVYPDGHFSSKRNIFDSCTLIGGRSSLPFCIDDPKKAAIQTCVEHIVGSIEKVSWVHHSNELQYFSADSIVESISSHQFREECMCKLKNILSEDRVWFHEGGNYSYSYVGTKTLEFPSQAISEYYIGEVFDKAIEQLQANARALSRRDVDDFAKNMIEPEEIVRSALDEFMQEANALVESITWNRDFVAKAQLDPMLSAMVDKRLAQFDMDGNLISNACAKASEKASAIFSDPAKGPYFLARLLTANSRRGDGIVGFYERFDYYARICLSKVQDLFQAVSANKTRRYSIAEMMQKFGRFRMHLDDYKSLSVSIWSATLEIKLYELLAEKYYQFIPKNEGLCYEMRNVLDKLLAQTDSLTYIAEITHFNVIQCREVVFDDRAKGSIFGLSDNVFDALKNVVRYNLSSKLEDFGPDDASKLSEALLNEIIASPDRWAIDEGNMGGLSKIASSLRRFADDYEPIASVTRLSEFDYFKLAYAKHSKAEKKAVVQKMVDYLSYGAAPRFAMAANVYMSDLEPLCYRFFTIPLSMTQPTDFEVNYDYPITEWYDLFKEVIGNIDHAMLSLSSESDRFSCQQMYFCMPIWLHADITQYEQAYHGITDQGIHINESESMDPPYADYPSLFPPQQWFRATKGNLTYVDAHEKAFREKLAEMIDKAKAAGIIRCNDQGYYSVELLAHHPDADELESFFNSYKEEKDNYSDGLLLGGAHLRNAMKARFGGTIVPIHTIGTLCSTNESYLLELIRKQMKLYAKIKDEVAYAEANIEPIVARYNRIIT